VNFLIPFKIAQVIVSHAVDLLIPVQVVTLVVHQNIFIKEFAMKLALLELMKHHHLHVKVS